MRLLLGYATDNPQELIAMIAIVLLAVSIAGAWALIHTYRHETAYARRTLHR